MASTTIARVGSQYDSLSSSDHRTPVLLKILLRSVFEGAANHSSAMALYCTLSRRTQVYNTVDDISFQYDTLKWANILTVSSTLLMSSLRWLV